MILNKVLERIVLVEPKKETCPNVFLSFKMVVLIMSLGRTI